MLSEKLEAEKKILFLQDLLQDATRKQEEQHHASLVDHERLKISLEKCRLKLNEVELENADLKSEAMKLKYGLEHTAEIMEHQPDVSKVAFGDTPYIQCGPGKVMKRHHEVDGDMMYFCDWDNNHVIPDKEEKQNKDVDRDVLAVKAFCENIMDGKKKGKEDKKLLKGFLPVCLKAFKPENPVDSDLNYDPVEGKNVYFVVW